MNNLTEQLVSSYSANVSAEANARGLVARNAFPKLFISADKTLIFGECEGSGKDNYQCSADFIEPESPIFRCTCPSRQIPCKHVLGLMFAYVQKNEFAVNEIPADIIEKREALQKKKEKKLSQEEPKPRQVNKEALTKKISTQLEGLELLRQLLDEIVTGGLGTVNQKTSNLVDEQIKNLGNYYLTGAQDLLRQFNLLFRNNENREKIYSQALQKVNALYFLYKKGKEYLENRLNDPELRMDTDTDIEELLGHTWQLDELEQYGRVANEAELLQLSFYSYSDEAMLSFVDEGIWCRLNDGRIFKTLNYRPYRAAKHIKEDDSYFELIKTGKLFVYPGDINNRIRWEHCSSRKPAKADYDRVRTSASPRCGEVLKQAKNIVKNPLGNKSPLCLLRFSRIGLIGDSYVVTDHEGSNIVLEDHDFYEIKTTGILKYLDDGFLKDQSLLVRFFYDIDRNFLSAQPLSLVTGDRILRLAF